MLVKGLGWATVALSCLGLFGFYAATRFKRCPANQVLVVQGAFTGPKGAKWYIDTTLYMY